MRIIGFIDRVYTDPDVFPRNGRQGLLLHQSRFMVGNLVVIAAFPCPHAVPPWYSSSAVLPELVSTPAVTHLHDSLGSLN
jgi:hypothetical protein